MSESLELYDSYVADCRNQAFETGKSIPILNKSASHATVLVRHLVESAEHRIDILTGDLYQGVYGTTVIAALRRFLGGSQDRRLRVLFDASKRASSDGRHVNHPVLNEVRSNGGSDDHAYAEQVDARLVPKSVASRYPFHFLVVDGVSVRFERNKETFDAFAQFNHPELGNLLVERFNDIWNLSAERM